MTSFFTEYNKISAFCKSTEFNQQIALAKSSLNNKPLVLYGAGAVGISAALAFKQNHINVSCFCDKALTGVQKDSRLEIISIATLKEKYSDANIIITSVNFANEIKSDLIKFGISESQIFPMTFLCLFARQCNDFSVYLNGYETAFNMLSDNLSRQILLGRVLCHEAKFPLLFSDTLLNTLLADIGKTQYFDEELITLTENEVFIDGGMYKGDTADIFFNKVKNKYLKYYGFEPDLLNFDIAKANLTHCKNAVLYNAGLFSSNGCLCFNAANNGSSSICTNAGQQAQVLALDNIDFGASTPTFIKMDIEGAELEALKGAKNIIAQFKPKLAVCAYHKIEDIYTLPMYIAGLRSDYKFYLRHYTNSIYETVLYAV